MAALKQEIVDMIAELNRVLNEASRLFIYRSDKETFKKIEHWQTFDEIENQIQETGKFVGDCEDFATYCVHELKHLGAQYLMCNQDDQLHIVCEIKGHVLDCNKSSLSRVEDYKVISAGVDGVWHEVTI